MYLFSVIFGKIESKELIYLEIPASSMTLYQFFLLSKLSLRYGHFKLIFIVTNCSKLISIFLLIANCASKLNLFSWPNWTRMLSK